MYMYVIFVVVEQAGSLERFDLEAILSLKGVGLSIVDDKLKQEVSYISITQCVPFNTLSLHVSH